MSNITSVATAEFSGGPVGYYKVNVEHPTSLQTKYTAECNDIIEALGMSFAEGEAFKALWRGAAARTLGLHKRNGDPVYDADKVAYYGARVAIRAKIAAAIAAEGTGS